MEVKPEDVKFENTVQADFDQLATKLIQKNGAVKAVAQLAFMVANFAEDVAYATPVANDGKAA